MLLIGDGKHLTATDAIGLDLTPTTVGSSAPFCVGGRASVISYQLIIICWHR